MPADPAVEIAEGSRGFVPADDKHVDLLAVRELAAADRARHGKVGGSPYQRVRVRKFASEPRSAAFAGETELRTLRRWWRDAGGLTSARGRNGPVSHQRETH